MGLSPIKAVACTETLHDDALKGREAEVSQRKCPSPQSTAQSEADRLRHDSCISNEEGDWECEEKGQKGEENAQNKAADAGQSKKTTSSLESTKPSASSATSTNVTKVTTVTHNAGANLEMSFTTEDNTPLILLKPHTKPVSQLQKGDYILMANLDAIYDSLPAVKQLRQTI